MYYFLYYEIKVNCCSYTHIVYKISQESAVLGTSYTLENFGNFESRFVNFTWFFH